jgi:hypothetical protein
VQQWEEQLARRNLRLLVHQLTQQIVIHLVRELVFAACQMLYHLPR